MNAKQRRRERREQAVAEVSAIDVRMAEARLQWLLWRELEITERRLAMRRREHAALLADFERQEARWRKLCAFAGVYVGVVIDLLLLGLAL